MSSKIFALGKTIPPDLKIWGTKKGEVQYWLLLPDGSPDPNTKPYNRRFEVEVHMQVTGEEYEIQTGRQGRKSTGWDKQEYDRAYDEKRNSDPDRKAYKAAKAREYRRKPKT